MDGGDEAVSGHGAEDEGAQLLPLLAEVMWVDLSEEDGQDHGQDRQQVHLPPVLQRQDGQRLNRTICTAWNSHQWHMDAFLISCKDITFQGVSLPLTHKSHDKLSMTPRDDPENFNHQPV